MAEDGEVQRAIIDRDSLPFLWPTHRHTSQFWEQLGRTVATFGFLEEVLGKAIFAFTASRRYKPEDIQACIDSAESAQVKLLNRMPQQVFSCPAPDVGVGCCRS